MKTKVNDFHEEIFGDTEEIANYCKVSTDGYFVNIITDDYEGHAIFHISVARKLRDVLDRAIAHVEKQGRTCA